MDNTHPGPQHSSGQARPTPPSHESGDVLAGGLHPGLADVALVNARQCADAACLSVSLWHELVRTGKAPAPAIRGTRFTRWRLGDVRAWLASFVGPQGS